MGAHTHTHTLRHTKGKCVRESEEDREEAHLHLYTVCELMAGFRDNRATQRKRREQEMKRCCTETGNYCHEREGRGDKPRDKRKWTANRKRAEEQERKEKRRRERMDPSCPPSLSLLPAELRPIVPESRGIQTPTTW